MYTYTYISSFPFQSLHGIPETDVPTELVALRSVYTTQMITDKEMMGLSCSGTCNNLTMIRAAAISVLLTH